MRAIYLAAILNGIVTTMLGPLMPGFEARWRLEDAHGGLLFVAQFLTSVLSAAATGWLARRIGYWGVVAAGLALSAIGVAGCTTGSWTVALLSVAVYGSGLGIITPASNVGLAAASGGNSAKRILWLNLVWSVGAVAAPALVVGLGRAFLPSLAGALLALAIAIAIGGAGHRPEAGKTAVRTRRLPHLTFAAMLFLYVGAEQSIAGWVALYANRSATARQLWAVLPSVFWGAILLGRVIAPNILHRVRSSSLATMGLGIALVGALLLVSGDGPVTLLAGSFLSGLGMAPIFPVVVAAYADRAGASASGLVFSAAGLGGGTLPWLVGTVSTASGSLRMGLVTVVALIAAMIVLQARIKRA